MYTFNIYNGTTLLFSITSDIFNYSIRKQENIVYICIRFSINIGNAVDYADQLTPFLNQPINIDVITDNGALLNLCDLILSDLVIDGLNGNNGLSITLKRV